MREGPEPARADRAYLGPERDTRFEPVISHVRLYPIDRGQYDFEYRYGLGACPNLAQES